MTARWRKLGRLYSLPEGGLHPKLRSHAANPLPVHLEGDVYRVFFSCRDAQNRSSVGAVDVDIVGRKVIQEFREPFFCYGPPGSYYSHGVSIGCRYLAGGARYVLFMGWHIPDRGHWRGEIGRLTLMPDLSLFLDGNDPLMKRDEVDPISLSYPWVLPQGSGSYRMWYGSTRTWDAGNGEMLHVINTATSTDGQLWRREGLAVPFELGTAQAFSRPTVAGGLDSGFEMWFSYRSGSGTTYRIGHATSGDGAEWELDLEPAGIGVSTSGWDCDMVAYPFVLDHGDNRYMLYNGNGYGLTGFGLAVQVDG